ncbi:MAG TPA: cytochrome C oxidase subunit IV family protein [Chitinophagales bacterium]|jgi:cytochrome c oxidase subunit 4|nr:cytochrome C oxidase subunit IV family protein [Chitinophagales bacterium]MBP6153416.1 cytochrome C oxidase subunit IV family protein [Chitinophagales bacterium]HQV79143.1 cytochrome C oxidase subunit IV family protein [Chitinophagales bacterium]HQW79901.1 cytochrome C oxidase subunit IV family protein [Chitinophagales bacterium]HRB19836.1 cytochrome C oxidase subunit IV family protein [Chitinophagales bacterium]
MANHMSDEQYNSSVKAVWSATAILSVVTVVEVIVALTVGHLMPKVLLNSFFVIASVAKAFFIIGEFMHLKYEKRVFMLSLGLPLAFLIWTLIALTIEGNYWQSLNFPK